MKSLKYTILIIFSITAHLSAQGFVFPITVSDGNVSHTINIGLNTNATDGFDAGIDALAPPAPPAGSFDTRLSWQDNEYYTDIRDTLTVLKTFPISYRPATGNEITLYWDNSIISTYGVFTIVDNPANPQFSLNMSTVDSLDVTTSTLISDSLKIIVNPGGLVRIEDEKDLQPGKYSLEQNYPNPFNPTTTIRYSLPKSSFVKIELFDLQGRKIKILLNESKSAGHHGIKFDGRDLSTGVYLYKFKADHFIQSKKLLFLK